MLFSKYINHPKWTEWCNKSYEEQEKIAEENMWDWYFEWYDVGDALWTAYAKADTDTHPTKKFGGYDRWDEEHTIQSSFTFLGADASFHQSKTPTHQWTEYNPCTNTDCEYNGEECGYFGENARMYDCFGEIFATIQAYIDVCGIDTIDEFAKTNNIHKDIIGWFKYGDKYFKRSDNMSKPFWVALSELKGRDDDISVFWTDGMMYINDKNDGQANTNTTLFQAYRFASLIQTPMFDYEATDEEVREFQKEILEFYRDDFSEEEQHQYIVDVWEYLDDIADDFFKLTGVKINDIDFKRAMVCYMSETDWESDTCMGFGSATYIARLLNDHILGDERHNVKGCNNPIAIKLANQYLPTSDYDLHKFAKALHEECKHMMQVPKDFNEFLVQAQTITEKCYCLLGYLVESQVPYNNEILVGYIDWFGDFNINDRYIYCHIDSINNEIYFQENRKSSPSAYLHDIAYHHLVIDQDRIQKDIKIKLTDTYIDDVIIDKMGKYDYEERMGYIYCYMYGTKGSV